MLDVTKENRFTVIKPTMANLDSHVAADFKSAFSKQLDNDPDFVLLDLSNVNFMDSSGLAAIVFCFQMVDIKDKLSICGVNDRVMKLFTLTQMGKVLHIFPTKENAMSVLSDD